MDYYYDINDHDEDDVPDISSPTSNNHHVEHSSPSLDSKLIVLVKECVFFC